MNSNSGVDVNKRLEKAGSPPVSMDAFRPNIVIGGDIRAYEEDEFEELEIGNEGGRIIIPKLCIRCAVTSVKEDGVPRDDGQPLRELSKYRTLVSEKDGVVKNRGVALGIYGIVFNSNTIQRRVSLHDEVRVVRRSEKLPQFKKK
jgi:uncharacterized protein YcbX